MQKNAINSQLFELESSLSELGSSSESYRIIGSIMVKSDKESLKKQLSSSKESLDIRLKSIRGQEEALRKRLSSLQEEVISKSKKQGDENAKG